jgi:class 3 adenylate cyclase
MSLPPNTSIPLSQCVIHPQDEKGKPNSPASEAARLITLRNLKLLDSPAEERFDRIIQVASKALNTPIAYVALVDADRQWFKSEIGIGQKEMPRNISFCTHAIQQDDPLIIPDARRDLRFASNPMVIGQPYIRFYAGRPLRSVNGYKVGTLCVADTQTRAFGPAEIAILNLLAELVEREFTLADTLALQQEAEKARQSLEESETQLKRALVEAESERNRANDLLQNILPAPLADELQRNGFVAPTRHEEVAVLFADFSGFTSVASTLSPEELVDELTECFCHFDWAIGKHGCEKLKTIGDGYLAVCGLPESQPDSALHLLQAAVEMRDFMIQRHAERQAAGKPTWQVRIGLHLGPIVAGIVGVRRIAYDIWGDTVNTASRIESNGEPGRINVSKLFYDKVADHVVAERREKIACKGKGEMEMYFINALKPGSAAE